MTYSLSTDAARMQLDVIHGFLSTSYWSPGVRREVVAAAIEGSVVIGIFDDATGGQVGFARAVTDGASFAWLCDVFVLPEHRGRGLAGRMIKALEAHPRMQTLRRWCLATRDAHALYRQHGYTPVPADRWMEKRLPESNWRAADWSA